MSVENGHIAAPLPPPSEQPPSPGDPCETRRLSSPAARRAGKGIQDPTATCLDPLALRYATAGDDTASPNVAPSGEGNQAKLGGGGGAARRIGPITASLLAFALALAVGAILILASGRDPVAAYLALFGGALGSVDRLAFAANKATPYILTAVGVALCFRAKVINIGGEGQIALGGLAATWVALNATTLPATLLIPAALLAGMAAGAAWAGLAAAIRLSRGVHEVLCTLLLNFVAVLLVAEALKGDLGEPGAGFPQSPLLPAASWLPRLPGSTLHLGIVLAVIAAIGGSLYLWRTAGGFRLRVTGASRGAAGYAGISYTRTVMAVMLISGALAGLAGGIEVMGVHRRLIEGFSTGTGFTAVGIALLAGSNPLAALPAGLLFGLLEAGALSMQRQVGVPSSLVPILQGLTMVFVLCAMGLRAREERV